MNFATRLNQPVAIIGHGASMLDKQRGDEIDAYPIVIRLKRCFQLLEIYPDCFGQKTSILACSRGILPEVVKDGVKRGVGEYWVLYDSRTYTKRAEPFTLERQMGAKVILCSVHLSKKWDQHYLDLRENQELDPRQETKTGLSDDKGHKHTSQGLKAVVYAMQFLRPSWLFLYGFDSVRTGKFDRSLIRGDEWRHYPDHNWAAEKAALDHMSQYYGIEVTHR